MVDRGFGSGLVPNSLPIRGGRIGAVLLKFGPARRRALSQRDPHPPRHTRPDRPTTRWSGATVAEAVRDSAPLGPANPSGWWDRPMKASIVPMALALAVLLPGLAPGQAQAPRIPRFLGGSNAAASRAAAPAASAPAPAQAANVKSDPQVLQVGARFYPSRPGSRISGPPRSCSRPSRSSRTS